MKSLYNRIVKNDQVTYGAPFQIKIPLRLQNLPQEAADSEEDGMEEAGDVEVAQPSPEELLEKARRECDLMLREAGLEADRLLEQARQEAERNAEQAMEEAWQRGYAEGMEAARLQNEGILAEAEEIRRSASEEHDSIMAGMEAEIVELSLEVARKVVSAELAVNDKVILQLVKEAMDNCSAKDGAVLRVSPEDYKALDESREMLLSTAEGADSLDIRKDSTLGRGDCIVETSFGSVDAGVETRLGKIEEAFREQLEGR
jgi:flagellar assembly protein FliH